MLPLILAPFSWLYGAVMHFRNYCYDRGLRKSFSFDQAVISVGNLSLGGTGKTPMIEYLGKLLSKEFSVAILSRGYGRKTKGFRLASDLDDATSIGDEPFQFYKKFKGVIEVSVCEDRVEGIKQLMSLRKSVQVILLDDAFQHRKVRPLFSILLTEFSKPFFNDFVLPMGRLREARTGAWRADVVIVTKCGELNTETVERYKNKIDHYASHINVHPIGKASLQLKPIYFSKIGYVKPVSLENSQIKKEIVLVTGIANSKPMLDHLREKVTILYHFDYGDHHDYTSGEISEIQAKAASMSASILTTEKDYAKLENKVDKKLWFYLPIETRFVNNGSEFDEMVVEKVKSHLRK